ncbi:MAG TPA: LamG-like jellyroll fold domain-containing protein, partial [Pirellulales bacterium]|nr:LamG-like jellyroll fold domain-containing protein [Pirellulales bacterium]
MKRLPSVPCLALAVLTVLASAGVTLAQPPSLSHLVPAAIQRGKSVDVVLHGANLAAPLGIWTNFSAATELTPGVDKNGTTPASVSYRMTTAADVPLGVAAIRLRTGLGVSNVRLVLVDDLAGVAKTGGNKNPATAQSVTLPIAVDGACDPETSDFYKFTVAAGQRVSVEVFAQRLGSPLDPVVRLLNAAGRELVFSDDELATGPDSRFAYKFDVAGEYFIEIRDIRFQGGGAHGYHLRLGDFPLPSVPYPLAAAKGSSAPIELAGKNVDLVASVNVTMPPSVPGDRFSVATGYTAGQGSSWVTLVASDTPDQLEKEPNDTPETSTIVTVPGAIEGRFAAVGDRDFYQFAATKGQRLSFIGQTRSLGSPADLYMRLMNEAGGVLAEAEDAGTDEGTLTHTFAADGQYRLKVEDTNHRGGPDEVYRILVKPYEAGFTLQAAAEKVDAPQNGVFVVKVTAVRRDYNGPITLSVEGAGEGCVLRHNVIPEGKPETTMHVTLGPSLAAGQLANLQIIGHAKIGETEFREAASTLGALRTSLSGLPFPPAVLDGALALGVGPVFPRYFQLTPVSPAVALVSAATPVSLKVQLSRSHGFDDKVDLRVEGLPKPATAKAAAIEKGKTEAALELISPQAIPPGSHKVRVIGTATFQNQPQEFVLDQVDVLGPPIAIGLAALGPLPAGGKQKATLSLAGQIQPVAPAATYASGVVRGAEGPRAPALAGFAADNKAAAFSGLDKAPGDDRLIAALPIVGGGDYSVELWIYNTRDLSQPNSPAISGYFFSRPGQPKSDNSQPGDHLGIGGVESSPRDKIFFYNGQSLVPGRTTLALNSWHHVALVRSGDDVRVYLDGDVAHPEIETKAAKNYSASQVVLGTRSDGFGPFQGRLDEVALFDVPLAPAQVQAHFAAAQAAAPARDAILKDNPVAYWPLDETDGQLAASVAPPHKRLVSLAWKNLPAGLAAPDQVVLVDAQD